MPLTRQFGDQPEITDLAFPSLAMVEFEQPDLDPRRSTTAKTETAGSWMIAVSVGSSITSRENHSQGAPTRANNVRYFAGSGCFQATSPSGEAGRGRGRGARASPAW